MDDLQDIIDAQAKILSQLSQLQKQNPEQKPTFGEHIADVAAHFIGSWKFIICQSLFFLVWVIYNSSVLFGLLPFDPYPFILLNLILSFQASFLSPMILMSQNRTDKSDRRKLENAVTVVTRIDTLLHEISGSLLSKQSNGKNSNGKTGDNVGNFGSSNEAKPGDNGTTS